MRSLPAFLVLSLVAPGGGDEFKQTSSKKNHASFDVSSDLRVGEFRLRLRDFLSEWQQLKDDEPGASKKKAAAGKKGNKKSKGKDVPPVKLVAPGPMPLVTGRRPWADSVKLGQVVTMEGVGGSTKASPSKPPALKQPRTNGGKVPRLRFANALDDSSDDSSGDERNNKACPPINDESLGPRQRKQTTLFDPSTNAKGLMPTAKKAATSGPAAAQTTSAPVTASVPSPAPPAPTPAAAGKKLAAAAGKKVGAPSAAPPAVSSPSPAAGKKAASAAGS